MFRLGLNEEDKLVVLMLFVGFIGVGKIEIVRCFVKKMGIEFIRFDMSEYVEKYVVLKFIGLFLGYVGYEEGGLFIDFIRKKFYCVLLFDEIEKVY